MSHSSMSQAEIDALLGGGSPPVTEQSPVVSENAGPGDADIGAVSPVSSGGFDLLPEEKDALGEIGNIAMGTAATPLSELLYQPVTITNPKTYIACQEEIFRSFDTPYMIIEVAFTRGLNGFNVLVIKDRDVAIIADLMMGGDGRPQNCDLDEMSISAAAEAMNQMIGTAATAMSDLFNKVIDVTPPKSKLVKDLNTADHHPLPTDEPVVVVQFELSVGDLLHTNIMQMTGLNTAREQVAHLFEKMGMTPPGRGAALEAAGDFTPGTGPAGPGGHLAEQLADPPTPAINQMEMAAAASSREVTGTGLEIALGLPVEAMLVVGRVKCRVADVANLAPGVVIDMQNPLDNAELVINGTVVAAGNYSNGKFNVTRLINSRL